MLESGRPTTTSPGMQKGQAWSQAPAAAMLIFYIQYLWAFSEGVPVPERRGFFQVRAPPPDQDRWLSFLFVNCGGFSFALLPPP